MAQEVTNFDKCRNSDAPQQLEQAPLRSAVTNFGRFYTLFNKLPYDGDREDLKESIVAQFTQNRTASLREMTRSEYQSCCAWLEEKTGQRDMLRKERSGTLKLMQQMGVDTTDWARINALCMDARIAGKPFAAISIEEHIALQKKLRTIERKGGFAKPGPRMVGQKRQRTKQCVVIKFDPSKTGEA